MRSIAILFMIAFIFLFSTTCQAQVTRIPNIKSNSDLYNFIVSESQKHDISVSLILAIIMQESTGRCNATSSSGAIGLMQIKYTTAREIGYRGSPSGLYDCRTNIKYAMKYLAMAAEKANGSYCLMLHYYHSGIYSNFYISTSSYHYCKSVMTYYREFDDIKD
jgi:soluble lytic murein transglycosylase-like protein